MAGYDTLSSSEGAAGPSGAAGGGASTNLAAPGEALPGDYAYRKWCGVRRSTWFLLLYTATYMAFLVLGGYAMRLIEQDFADGLKEEARQMKKQFIEKYPLVNYSDLENLLQTSQDFMGKGISILDKDEEEKNWSFGQSVLFTVTVVTTIGYGHVTPLTSSGKLFTILYAILGIPFTLVFITAAVQRLLEPTCSLLAYFFIRLGGRFSPFVIRVLHLSVMTIRSRTLVTTFFVVLPSLAFHLIESEWSFLDGFYFVFISLTTIGLGDYIPGDERDHGKFKETYKTAVAVYLLLGLVFITLGVTVFYDIPQLNLGVMLQQQQDLHIPSSSSPRTSVVNEEEAEQTEKTWLSSSFGKILGRDRKNEEKTKKKVDK